MAILIKNLIIILKHCCVLVKKFVKLINQLMPDGDPLTFLEVSWSRVSSKVQRFLGYIIAVEILTSSAEKEILPFLLMADSTDHSVFSCRKCRTAIALRDDLLSKSFWAKSGRAYLFRHAMNIVMGPKEERQLITGNFVIANIYCHTCGEGMGWKYIQAYNEREKYKEGKFIIEKSKILKEY